MTTQTLLESPSVDVPDIEEDDRQYHQYVQNVVAKGQRQVQNNQVFTLDQVEKRLERWLKNG